MASDPSGEPLDLGGGLSYGEPSHLSAYREAFDPTLLLDVVRALSSLCLTDVGAERVYLAVEARTCTNRLMG